MDIRALQHDDISLIAGLTPPGWEGVTRAIDFYINADFCFPVKVTVDRIIVGIGCAIIHNDIAWLAHIIVHPDYRNRSIGKLITQTLVESSNAKGCDTVYLLATELGEPVYSKIGFETETEYLFFKGEKTAGAFVSSGNVVAFSNDFKEQISDLDRQVSGEDRMLQLEPHFSDGFVYLKDSGVEGFYLPALGDGLIIASSDSAGQELMKLRLASKDFAAFPIDNVCATGFLRQHNFKKVRSEKRMRLGKKRSWQPANIYNRIGGNLG